MIYPLPHGEFVLLALGFRGLKIHRNFSELTLAPRRCSSGPRVMPKLSDYGVPVLDHVVAGW